MKHRIAMALRRIANKLSPGYIQLSAGRWTYHGPAIDLNPGSRTR